jgi:hypothetical protein
LRSASGDVGAIDEKEVEREIDEPAGVGRVARGLHRGKAGRAVGPHGAELAVEIGVTQLERGERLHGRPVPMRPVQSLPREQLDLADIDPRVQPIAVIFDLVQPSVAGRGLADESSASCGRTQVGGD